MCGVGPLVVWLLLIFCTIGRSQEAFAQVSLEERQQRAIAVLWCQAPNDGMLHFFKNQRECRTQITPVIQHCWEQVKSNSQVEMQFAKKLTDCSRSQLKRRHP